MLKIEERFRTLDLVERFLNDKFDPSQSQNIRHPFTDSLTPNFNFITKQRQKELENINYQDTHIIEHLDSNLLNLGQKKKYLNRNKFYRDLQKLTTSTGRYYYKYENLFSNYNRVLPKFVPSTRQLDKIEAKTTTLNNSQQAFQKSLSRPRSAVGIRKIISIKQDLNYLQTAVNSPILHKSSPRTSQQLKNSQLSKSVKNMPIKTEAKQGDYQHKEKRESPNESRKYLDEKDQSQSRVQSSHLTEQFDLVKTADKTYQIVSSRNQAQQVTYIQDSQLNTTRCSVQNRQKFKLNKHVQQIKTLQVKSEQFSLQFDLNKVLEKHAALLDNSEIQLKLINIKQFIQDSQSAKVKLLTNLRINQRGFLEKGTEVIDLKNEIKEEDVFDLLTIFNASIEDLIQQTIHVKIFIKEQNLILLEHYVHFGNRPKHSVLELIRKYLQLTSKSFGEYDLSSVQSYLRSKLEKEVIHVCFRNVFFNENIQKQDFLIQPFVKDESISAEVQSTKRQKKSIRKKEHNTYKKAFHTFRNPHNFALLSKQPFIQMIFQLSRNLQFILPYLIYLLAFYLQIQNLQSLIFKIRTQVVKNLIA